MKRLTYNQFGDPTQVLQLTETDAPQLKPGEARIKVLRAPINPSDVVQIAGHYGTVPNLPAGAGNEGLGEIVEINGDGLAIGQKVMLPDSLGTWSTEMIGEISKLIPLPDGDLDQLCMLAVNPATAYLLLTKFVDLQPGDWIIQSAANSAVGTYLVQLAKARGIKTVGVVRRESAIAEVEENGADLVLVDGEDLAEQVLSKTGSSMKLAIDPVAGETFGRLAETLEPGGTLVLYGGISNEPATMQVAPVIFNDVRVRGFWLVHWLSQASQDEQVEVYIKLTQAIASGDLYAPIDRHFKLEEIGEAIEYTMAGGRKGKVLLIPNGL